MATVKKRFFFFSLKIRGSLAWSPVGRRNETKKVVEHFIDVCKMFQKKNGRAVLVNALVEAFVKNGKIPTSCPIKKDSYYYHNMTLNGIDFPMVNYFLTDHDTIFDVDFLIKVQKKLISAFHVIVYGGFKIVQ